MQTDKTKKKKKITNGNQFEKLYCFVSIRTRKTLDSYFWNSETFNNSGQAYFHILNCAKIPPQLVEIYVTF